MIFTLIKNELIKLMKRGKTWIVFGLFVVMTVGLNVMAHFSDKDMRYYMSPQGQIENLDRSIGWEKENLARAEQDLKNDPNGYAKEYVVQIKENIARYEEERKVQEERLKLGDKPDSWKEDLALEKKSLQEQVDNKNFDEDQKSYAKTRLEEIKMIEEAGIKPVESWEFDPFNNTIGFFNLLGTIILISGIAVFMSDIVSGEATPPTLKFLLVQPISRGKVLISKFIAVTLTVVTMIAGLEAAAFGVVGAIKGFECGNMPIMIGQKYFMKISQETGGWPQMYPVEGSASMTTVSDYMLQSFGLQILFIIACCAFIFLISTLFKSSMITMAVSVILSVATTMISMSVGKVRDIAHLLFLNYGATPGIIKGDVAYMYNNVNFTPELGATLMIITIVVCPIIAYIVFKRKDILI